MSAGSLSPPPAHVKVEVDSKDGKLANGIKPEPRASGSNDILTPLNGISPVKSEPMKSDAGDEDGKVFDNEIKIEEQKRLYAEEEKKLKDLEPPPAERLQDE